MLKKRFLILLLIVVLLAPMSALAQDGEKERKGIRPDAPTYGVRGPHPVGVMELVIENGERPLNATIWYPALNPEEVAETYTYEEDYSPVFDALTAEGHAIADAEMDGANAPYPLIIFSHALHWTRLQSVYYTEHLASYGFVVIAPDHTGETFASMGEDFWPYYYYRPVDIQRTIAFADELTAADGAMPGLIDTDRIAVTGHSSGGWTSLAAGGARMDFGALRTYCDEYGEDLPIEDCDQLPPNADALAELFGLDAVPDGLWPAIYDDRVDAIVPLSPDTNIFGTDGFAQIQVPIMVFVGTNDAYLPPEINAYPLYENVSSEDKALVVFAEADHMIFGDSCDALPWLVDMGAFGACADLVWDVDRAHDLIDHFTTAFLLWELKGDEDAKAALMPEVVTFPGITYEATFE